MIRVVLDTNIIISAHLQHEGLPATVLDLALQGVFVRLFFSEAILAEYEEVLNRPRFRFEPDEIADSLGRIRAAGVLVEPTERVTAAFDPDDNIFLECAQAADAHYLVTGNCKDFPALWRSTRVVTAREFVAVISNSAQ